MALKIILCHREFGPDQRGEFRFALHNNRLIQLQPQSDARAIAESQPFLIHEAFSTLPRCNTESSYVLWEAKMPNPPQHLEDGPLHLSLSWANFPKTAAALQPRGERNLLQLAVQFLAAAGIEDSLDATELSDKELADLTNHYQQKD